MSKFDLYQTVTDRVLDLMRTHGANWANPFNKNAKAFTAYNITSGKAYRGINQVLLGSLAFESPAYGTFGQWKNHGCMVRRGQKSSMIVFWKILEKNAVVEGKSVKSKLPLLRYFNVFNAAQVEALNETGAKFLAKLTAKIEAPTSEERAESCVVADAFIAATKADVRYSNECRAYYSPALDYIHMPKRENFRATATSTATETFYGTALHETVHWTGHAKRLNRDFSGRFGDSAYAFEELVAEMGAAMLSAQLGISVEPRADHAQYLNNWMKVLQNDNKAIIKAATLAKNAAAYLSEFSAVEVTEEEEEEAVAA